jgi:ribosome-associated protein
MPDVPPEIRVSPALAIAESELDERFVRASGPGGQNVNKVATAVELRFDLSASALPDGVKLRLAALAGRRLGADGVLVIHAREHRTQSRNRAAARERLRELLRQAAAPPKSRRKTRPSRAARQRRMDSKFERGRLKAGRSRVRQEEEG